MLCSIFIIPYLWNTIQRLKFRIYVHPSTALWIFALMHDNLYLFFTVVDMLSISKSDEHNGQYTHTATDVALWTFTLQTVSTEWIMSIKWMVGIVLNLIIFVV